MIDPIYATPLYSNRITNYNEINKDLDKVIKKIKIKKPSKEWGQSLSSSPFTSNLIADYKLNLVQEAISQHIVQYGLELGTVLYKDDFIIDSAWLSLYKKGDYSHSHFHATSDLSGVYYYKTNGRDGDINFESPNPYLQLSKLYNYNSIPIKPEVGKILIFPAWLRHHVKTNLTYNTRISLAFNVRFTDKFRNR